MPVIYMEKSSISALTEKDIKKIIDENSADTKYRTLEDYYIGKHPILNSTKRDSTAPNNKIVNNMPKYITDTAVGYFLGQPVLYSSQNDSYHRQLQDTLDYNDEQDENIEIAKTCSICGNCFEMLYMDEDAQIRFVKISPANCIMIYETGYSTPLAAIRTIHSRDKYNNEIKKVEFWNATECWYFQSVNGGSLNLLDIQEHYWHDVPFIEFINNKERQGDFEGVVSIVDAYNRAQSNTANYFQYNDEAILKILKIGNVTSQDIIEMKEQGAVILEDGGDMDWLIKQINDAALENYKNRLREDMHTYSNVPNLTDANFGGNLSGVAISYKFWVLEQACSIKVRKFKRALQRRVKLITNILNIRGGNYDFRDIDIQFRRNKPQNLVEIAQIITQLSGDLSRETRLQMLPIIDNVKKELEKLENEKQADLQGFGSYDSLAAALMPEASQMMESGVDDESQRPELLD